MLRNIAKFLGLGGSSVTVNGHEFKGNNITIHGDKVVVDGVSNSINLGKEIRIAVNGNVEKIESSCGDIDVAGNVGEVKTSTGDVQCHNIHGNVNTTTGDVSAEIISGGVKTTTGDICYR